MQEGCEWDGCGKMDITGPKGIGLVCCTEIFKHHKHYIQTVSHPEL